MTWNFELLLFYATVITGVIALFDVIFLSRMRAKAKPPQDMPVLIDYARSFFPILLIVFVLRSFLFEPFRIPSGSLEPTLLSGDFILVNKYNYGIRLPVTHKKVTEGNKPERGDIVVFRWPGNPEIVFIKRIIGLPGDKISYVNKKLTVNGKSVPQSTVTVLPVIDDNGTEWSATEKSENLLGVDHKIYIDAKKKGSDYNNIVVPEGMYFVMGDNRDNSDDSRFWGFVPDNNLVGKAVVVWMSWAGKPEWVRWNRIGMKIQ